MENILAPLLAVKAPLCESCFCYSREFQFFFLFEKGLLQSLLRLDCLDQSQPFPSEVEFLGARSYSRLSLSPCGSCFVLCGGQKSRQICRFYFPVVNILVQKITLRKEAYKSEKYFGKILMFSGC